MSRAAETTERVYKEILNSIEEKGFPPTVKEIAENLNIGSTSTVHRHLNILEKKGKIHREPSKPRAVSINNKVSKTEQQNETNICEFIDKWKLALENERKKLVMYPFHEYNHDDINIEKINQRILMIEQFLGDLQSVK